MLNITIYKKKGIIYMMEYMLIVIDFFRNTNEFRNINRNQLPH